MVLQHWIQWLLRKAPEEDTGTRVCKLMERLHSPYFPTRLGAEQVLAQIAFCWEGYYDLDFVVALMEALQTQGDSRSLPYIEHLANDRARSDVQKRVQAAARACLPHLQARAEQEYDSQTLLRPGRTDPASAKGLLRPAAETSGADPTQLLRPVTSEEKV
jgi:hypothetical protein